MLKCLNPVFRIVQKFAFLRKIIVINAKHYNKLGKRAIIFVLAFTFILSSYAPLNVQDIAVRTIVIDAGHGGKDPGCLGKHVEEADVALNIALKLKDNIQKNLPGVNVILTRDSDKFIELHERAKIANESGADLFISIHCNSSPSTSAYGTETYTMGLHKTSGNLMVMERENSVIKQEDDYEKNYEGFEHTDEYYIMREILQSSNIRNSVKFASKVEKKFVSKSKRRSRGINQAGFLVLWKTTMPSVLIETGFLSNSTEESFLKTTDGQQKIAEGIFEAVKEYKSEMDELNKQ